MSTLEKALKTKPNPYKDELVKHGISLYNKRIEHENTMVRALIESIKMLNENYPNVTIIHGPPGTGKSTITAEIVLQIMAKGTRVKNF